MFGLTAKSLVCHGSLVLTASTDLAIGLPAASVRFSAARRLPSARRCFNCSWLVIEGLDFCVLPDIPPSDFSVWASLMLSILSCGNVFSLRYLSSSVSVVDINRSSLSVSRVDFAAAFSFVKLASLLISSALYSTNWLFIAFLTFSLSSVFLVFSSSFLGTRSGYSFRMDSGTSLHSLRAC
jgi:hypothetical protein